MNEALLELRKRMKKKKPNFIRQDAHKKKRLGKKWRKPKGIQSKMRLKLRGYRGSVLKGYKSPKKVRGLHKSGLKMVLINSIKEMKRIEKEEEGIVISKRVGLKKKIEIIKQAEKGGIKVLNIKDVKKFLSSVEEIFKKKGEAKEKEKKTKAEKEEKKEEVVKKKAEVKKGEKTEKEKEEEEKKEKDKILTKKQ